MSALHGPRPRPPRVTLSCSYLVGFHIGLGKTQLIVTHAGTVHVLSIGTSTSPLPAFSLRVTSGASRAGRAPGGRRGGCSRQTAKGTRTLRLGPPGAQLQRGTGRWGPALPRRVAHVSSRSPRSGGSPGGAGGSRGGASLLPRNRWPAAPPGGARPPPTGGAGNAAGDPGCSRVRVVLSGGSGGPWCACVPGGRTPVWSPDRWSPCLNVKLVQTPHIDGRERSRHMTRQEQGPFSAKTQGSQAWSRPEEGAVVFFVCFRKRNFQKQTT